MAKKLIYQVYTGKKSRLYDYCTASVKAYAEDINSKEIARNRVDYVIQTQPIMKIKPDVFATNRSKESYEKYGGFLPIFEKEKALKIEFPFTVTNDIVKKLIKIKETTVPFGMYL